MHSSSFSTTTTVTQVHNNTCTVHKIPGKRMINTLVSLIHQTLYLGRYYHQVYVYTCTMYAYHTCTTYICTMV